MTRGCSRFLGVLLVGACLASAGTTEFGGMVSGEPTAISRLLETLKDRPGITWIRGNFPPPPNSGWQWLDDVRYRVPSSAQSRRLPDDLFQVYWACRTNLTQESRTASAYEVWNEPDFHLVENSAADMAAVLKAAWWGIKSTKPDATVLMPSLAFCPSRYAVELARNGLGSWTDGWNCHYYGYAADFEPFLVQHRRFARRIGVPDSIWLTEVGYFHTARIASPDEAFLSSQAAFHERLMVESWVARVDRHLLFNLSPYSEGGMDLGLTDREGHVRPALTSVRRLAMLLGDAQPRWRLVHEATGESVGVVLERSDGTWSSILWSSARPRELRPPGAWRGATFPERQRLQIRWPKNVQELHVGLEGDTTLAPAQLSVVDLGPERNLFIAGPPERYRVSGCRWVPIRSPQPDSTTGDRRARAILKDLPPHRDPSPVVVRFRPGAGWRADKPSQTLNLPPDQPGMATLQFHNFTDQPQSGTWSFSVPHGWSVQTETPTTSESPLSSDATKATKIPAFGLTEFALVVGCDPATPVAPGQLKIQWTGAGGESDEVSLRLAPDVPLPAPWWRFRWQDFRPSPEHPAAWRVFEIRQDVFTLEIIEPGKARSDAVVFLPMPTGVRSQDIFSVNLRRNSGSTNVWAQAFLLTEDGEVWRYGDWESIPPEGLSIRGALEDFAPTAWSRHRSFLVPPVHRARWFAIRFQGVTPGQVIEVESPGLSRAEEKPGPTTLGRMRRRF